MIGLWIRNWRRSSLLTGQFLLTIAIGMGGASALVSLTLALGSQPLPFRDPAQTVAVWENLQPSGKVGAISGPDLTEIVDATHNVFAAFGGFVVQQLWIIDNQDAAQVHTCYIQPNVFSDLGIRPIVGRGVLPDDAPLADGATVPAWISYQLWQNRYGGSPSVIGTAIAVATSPRGLDRGSLRIVGVLPAGVSIPLPFMENTTDVWFLLPRDVSSRPRQSTIFFGIGRLLPGVSATQAQAALAVVAENRGQRYSFDQHKHPVVQGLQEIAQAPARKTMGLLVLGVGLVFLVGCVNLAILMGTEGRQRRQGIAIRAVLGASRRRLWREVAAEKSALTILSLIIGAAFAAMLLRALTVLVPDAGLGPPILQPPHLNLAVLLGFAALALVAALVWSALLVVAADGDGALRSLAGAGGGMGYTGRSDSSRGAGRWRLILLSVQAGIGICLLAAAALTAKTYSTLSAANLGPDPRQTVLLSIEMPDNISSGQLADINQQVLSRLGRLPGTRAIALVDHFPPLAFPISFLKQGDAAGTERSATNPNSISPDYFRALGIPILFGRGFDDTDNRGSEPVAIISQDMAEQNWSLLGQAVGSQITLPIFKEHFRIVGVAGNFTGYWSQKPVPTIYLPKTQSMTSSEMLILRTDASPRTVAALAPQMLAGMPMPPIIWDVSTIHARWQARFTRPLARMAGMLLLALLGLGLSIQGVYAVAAGAVEARLHELAVRSALGAQPGRLAWNLTREMLIAVVVGSALGVALSLELHPLLKQWLGPTAVWQAEPIAVAVVLLVLAAAIGGYVPARSAARTNPAEVLRRG